MQIWPRFARRVNGFDCVHLPHNIVVCPLRPYVSNNSNSRQSETVVRAQLKRTDSSLRPVLGHCLVVAMTLWRDSFNFASCRNVVVMYNQSVRNRIYIILYNIQCEKGRWFSRNRLVFFLLWPFCDAMSVNIENFISIYNDSEVQKNPD